MSNNIIPIFFAIDDKFIPYLDCAVSSMMQNCDKSKSYKVYVLYEDVPQDRIKAVSDRVKAPVDIEFVEMKQKFNGLNDRSENRLRCNYFTMTIYFRLFIADLFPQYDKGIYIDSDIVVPGDISKLYEIDLEDNIIGACADYSFENVTPFIEYIEKCIGADKYHYINSGVLLMNFKKMRELKFSNHFLRLLNTYHFDSVAPDQDYINAMCKGKIKYLDGVWDAMPPDNSEAELYKNPQIIHYNLFQKPWYYDNIPYEEYFWSYAKKSPFYQDILNTKNSFDEDRKKSDQQCLDTMLNKACEIGKTPNTFVKVEQGGEKVKVW